MRASYISPIQEGSGTLTALFLLTLPSSPSQSLSIGWHGLSHWMEHGRTLRLGHRY